jgi:predicted nucleic acid-binding protein
MPVLFDSSIYPSALRAAGDAALLLQRWARESPIWLSSVVIEELYAGANPNDYRVVEKLERDFERARRVLVPNLSDWTQAGKVLARLVVCLDNQVHSKSIRNQRVLGRTLRYEGYGLKSLRQN